MNCLRCGKPTESSALCAACLGEGRQYSPQRFEERQQQRLNENWQAQLGQYMKPLIGVGLVVLAFVLFPLLRGKPTPKPLPSTVAEASGGPRQTLTAACSGYQRCLVAYITPWCPGCRASVPFLHEARSYLRTLGDQSTLQVIVGDGEESQLTALATEVGGHVFVDRDSQLKHQLQVRGVPAWFLVNQEGLIIDRGSAGGVSGAPIQELMRYFIPKLFSDDELRYFLPSSAS